MNYLKFDVRSVTWQTTEPDPDDEWDRASTDAEVEVLSCKISDNSYDALPIDFEVKAGSIVWLVWATYSTGDSFGTDGGQYELCSVFESEAEAKLEKIRLLDVKDYSVPWSGYFENLEGINIQEMTVLP